MQSPTMATVTERPPRGTAKVRLLDAALVLVRRHGLAATSVDGLCQFAGVSKGAFFHHFASKDDLAVAAAEHWTAITSPVFESADYHRHVRGIDRVLGYLDLRSEIAVGPTEEYTCFVGTMVQEAHTDSPSIAQACADSMFGHVDTLVDDFRAAIEESDRSIDADAASLARHTQAVLQGAFILAKARHDPNVVREHIAHLRRYIELLFHVDEPVAT
jgi:TetR/AcrR family transcriptional repressor of nem operon